MAELLTSRRMVIGGGAVAGAAMLAPMVMRKASVEAASDGVTVVSGGLPRALAALKNDPAEIGQWQALVGRPVRLAGGDGVGFGVIEAVEPTMIPSGRPPAGLRQNPFTVRFAVDPVGAPAGDAIYDVGATIDGLSRLFLQRGANRAGKAILTALFA